MTNKLRSAGSCKYSHLHKVWASYNSTSRALVGLYMAIWMLVPFLFATLFNNQKTNIVALYQVTVKKEWRSAGQVIEPGMSVQVTSDILADPILIQGGQLVRNAFLRIYGVDLQEMRALNGLILESKRIG